MNNISDTNQILKNLHAVLVYSKERYTNEFELQDIKLSEKFKIDYRNYLIKKKCSITYLEHTSIIKNKEDKYIFVPNQWFAIASYFVDFCTEMLTYASYFAKIHNRLGITGNVKAKEYATHLRSCPTLQDREAFINAAINVLQEEFPNSQDNYARVAVNLWKFSTDYKWWTGSKTIDRDDFFISPLLNQLNVVNANSEYLARIVHAYASNLNLRVLTEHLTNFAVGAKTKEYKPSLLEEESYKEAEAIISSSSSSASYHSKGISISAASLERFHSMD